MIPQRLSAALLAVAVAACNQSNAAPPAPPPAEVGVITVERRTLPLGYEFVGEVQPIKRVEVRARVDGVIEVAALHRGLAGQAGPGALSPRPDPVRRGVPERAAR